MQYLLCQLRWATREITHSQLSITDLDVSKLTVWHHLAASPPKDAATVGADGSETPTTFPVLLHRQ